MGISGARIISACQGILHKDLKVHALLMAVVVSIIYDQAEVEGYLRAILKYVHANLR